jgi:DNA-binding transcriptional LysR family regulator
MDITLARTFLMVAETGSFIDAARRMNVTQSTVSARIKGLEDMFGRLLFDRSKNGAALTGAGEQFQKHALALVRLWQHAQHEVGLAGQHRDHLAVGAPAALWDGFLIKFIAWLRANVPDIAISASASVPALMVPRLLEGTLDLAVMYQPGQPPGFTIEHLFDEELVLVTSATARRRGQKTDYVYVDWGADFAVDHAAAYPELANTSVNLDLGSMGLDYLLANQASGYFPRRLVQHHIGRGRLRIPARSRSFTSAVYMVYPESRDEEAFEPILQGLRRAARRLG